MLPANVVNALQIISQHQGRPLPVAGKDAPKDATHQPGQELQGTAQTDAGKGLLKDAAQQLARLQPGQELQATVQAKISEGVFKVQVAGQLLQMRLPDNIQSGDTLRLQVISLQPKITFGLVASTNPLSTPEQIGSSARMLANLADLPMERPLVQQLGNKAVWPSAGQAPDAKLLSGALREALGRSGLFYESHQAQWVRGQRSTMQLLEEPQNLLTGRSHTSAQTGRPEMQTAANQPAATLKQLDTASSTQANPSGANRAAEDAPLPVARELLPLVQQQLHTLEHHHLVWMGQVWPGQQMQWEIQGEPEYHAPQPDERQWSTEMELSLPKLGDIHARLLLTKQGLQLNLRAADGATVELFNRALPSLKESLFNAEIPMVNATVEKS